MLAVVFLTGVAVFALAAYVHPGRPGVTSPEGWFGGYDQSRYLRITEGLADWRLPTTGYLYGIGYPLVGVPLTWLGFADPYTPVNALLFGVIVLLTTLLGERLRGLGFGVVAALAVALATPLLDILVIPWNAMVIVPAVVGGLLLATSAKPLTWRGGAVLGLLVGMAFAARYVDAVFVAGIAAVALLRPGRRSLAAILTAGTVAAAAVGFVLYTHDHAFDSPWTTPYSLHRRGDVTDQDLAQYQLERVPRHFVEVFVTGESDGVRQGGEPLLPAAPWLLLAPIGLFVVFRWSHPARPVLGVAAGLSVVSSAFYLSFAAGGGADLPVGGLRYFAPWFPLWGILAALGLACLLFGPQSRRNISKEENSSKDLDTSNKAGKIRTYVGRREPPS